jgi:hypothetical protein
MRIPIRLRPAPAARPATLSQIADRLGRLGHRVALSLAGVAVLGGALLTAGSASAYNPPPIETPKPQWTISAVSTPTVFSPSAAPGEDHYTVLITNTGDFAAGCTKASLTAEWDEMEANQGLVGDKLFEEIQCEEYIVGASPETEYLPVENPITITDELPKGLTLDVAGASGDNTFVGRIPRAGGKTPTENFHCILNTCTYTGVVLPDQTLKVTFPVDISPEAEASSPLDNVIRVSGGAGPGGGGDATHVSIPTVVSASQKAAFGMAPGAATTALSTTQAGAHPDITTSYAFTSIDANDAPRYLPKDITYRLPAGFADDFADTPFCTDAQFAATECPTTSQVGITTVQTVSGEGSVLDFVEPVYNLVPDSGSLAELAFNIGDSTKVEGDITLRRAGEADPYGADVTFHNISNLVTVTGGSLTVWGDPAADIHNPVRFTPGYVFSQPFSVGGPDLGANVPYFTNPTTCGQGPLHSEFSIDSWEAPGAFTSAPTNSYGPITGCDRLAIEPKLEVQASANSAETATGLGVNLEIPQHYENPRGIVASNLDDAKVVLPAGMTVNPSAGAGLAACTEAEFAYEGGALKPELGRGCPRESKLGSAHARSPGVPEHEEATGSLFLAKPYENKFGSLLAIYLVLRIPKRGVVVTAAGKVELNQETGQLTTTFDENPQLPVSDFVFTFHQGATSPLVTPPACGGFTSESDLTPWSEPLQEHLLTSTFEITNGVNGGPCPSGGVPPFRPQVISGTQDNAAGSYSPFYLRIQREDGEQEITRFTTVLPPGLTGNLTGIPFCPEADIEAARGASGAEELERPSCPQASEIGHTIVEAGVGSVLAQTPGKVYLAGPYHGAPLSVVSITAAKVGPFDLGTVVIRFALDINPITAQVEINGATSDPIPHIIKGIVVHVRDIRTYIDREKFILNPTNCDPLSISDTITGAGADYANPADQVPVGVSTPFQAADCQNLRFKPAFTASTSGRTSKANGASLSVKIAYPDAPQGTQANIKEVRVELPKRLPSRLTTLQKGCTVRVFEANPASCPADSIIGHAKALTPILPVPLEGPAYFVSHGGASFPELIMVLQGYGFTIYLHGETFISAKGITSSTFPAVPDEPVTSFELTLPEGPYSALAAPLGLCKTKLAMPTEFVAQNGVVLHQTTKIAVTGCPKARRAPKKHRHKHSGRAKGRKK